MNSGKSPILPDNRVGDIICSNSLEIADVVIVWTKKDECLALTKSSVIANQPEIYKISNEPVIEVQLVKNHELLILKTNSKTCFRDYKNQAIPDSESWADYFIEPYNQQFYRKDIRDHWFDIEGQRLEAPFFLQYDVLCSLVGKTSKKSLSFRGKNIVMSPRGSMIQVGKVVFDQNLEVVRYYGKKITGLGTKNITLANSSFVQEIYLGLKTKAFIDEITRKPFLVNEEPVVEHSSTVKKGKHLFEVFKTSKNTFVLNAFTSELITCDQEAVTLNFSTYLKMDTEELILCKGKKGARYMDLLSQSTYTLDKISDDPITHIDATALTFNEDYLRNMSTENRTFVYNETRHEIFSLNDGQLIPEAISEPKHYSNYFGIATINGKHKLFYKKNNQIVKLEKEGFEVEKIISVAGQKLLNALSTTGEKIVLDARKGYDQLSCAYANGQALVEVFDKPEEVGYTVVQNALLETLGGTQKRVVDLNKSELSIFTLPKDLKASPENKIDSAFRSNPIVELHFDKVFLLDGQIFIPGLFVPYHETPTPILIQAQNGRPLHLEGGGYRHELVIGFQSETLSESYYLGIHRMIGAITLTEDLKEREILFSLQTKRSWLMMEEAYLPIFKKVVPHKSRALWDYLLLELRRISSSKEYIVVEKKSPHRILVLRQKDIEVPKIVSNIEKSLKMPKKLSGLRKLFGGDPGYLKEIS